MAKKFLKIFDNYDDFKMKQGSVMAYPNIVLFRDNQELLFNKPYEEQYFTIQVLEDGNFTVDIPTTSTSFKYRLNGGDWVTSAKTIVSESLNAFDIIEISCVCDNFRENAFDTTSIKFNAYGNIMSLLYGDKFIEQKDLTGKDSAFRQLFRDSKLLSAENLILPATTLAENCYEGMFYGCTSLTTAPLILPATTLASNCYDSMFWNCISLTTAPVLPATELASRCYSIMFKGCTSLTEAPELPATKLADYCYSSMFLGCTSLTTAPELPATELTSNCYADMFRDCTSLETTPELPATTLAVNCYGNMFEGCTSLTETPELPATTLTRQCYRNMFEGCTSLETAPELPATTLAVYCYSGMFSGCTNLNYIKMLATDISASNCLRNWVDGVSNAGIFVKAQGVEIPSGTSGVPEGWTVEEYDYSKELFTIEALGDGTIGIGIPSSASSLKYRKNDEAWIETSEAIQVSVMTNDTIQISCVNNYFNSNTCSSIFAISIPFNVKGNIMSLLYGDDFEGQIDLSGKDNAFDYLFKNCTTLQSAENLALPATRLASSCYRYMFNGCTSLTVAPELPSTTLASHCYYQMFQNCTSLTTAPVLSATELADSCYSQMFAGCTSLTITPELSATKLADRCYSGMFQGCTSLTTAPDLPATELTSRCYFDMFNGCTSLTTAPELPAATLVDYCYQQMFNGCTSLTTTPALPATKLADRCYQGMFKNCKSLETAPELPATELATYCYSSMFSICTSLETAPELPATELADGCYYNMFNGCNKLNSITMLATDISATGCLTNWVQGVASTGTFVKHHNMITLPTGVSGIPNGWTVENNHLFNGYEFVDLGLPSGTLWAKCDYGANSETEDGLYFSRLNSVNGLPSSQIPDDIPPTPSQGQLMVNFNNSVVESQEDAIPKLMGDGWSMPKNSDIEELIENTNQEMTEINGVKGTKFINRNDKTLYIFFPYSEYNYGTYVCWLNDVYTHGDNTTSPSRFMTMFDPQKSNDHFTHIGYQTFGAKANRYRGIIRKK